MAFGVFGRYKKALAFIILGFLDMFFVKILLSKRFILRKTQEINKDKRNMRKMRLMMAYLFNPIMVFIKNLSFFINFFEIIANLTVWMGTLNNFFTIFSMKLFIERKTTLFCMSFGFCVYLNPLNFMYFPLILLINSHKINASFNKLVGLIVIFIGFFCFLSFFILGNWVR